MRNRNYKNKVDDPDDPFQTIKPDFVPHPMKIPKGCMECKSFVAVDDGYKLKCKKTGHQVWLDNAVYFGILRLEDCPYDKSE